MSIRPSAAARRTPLRVLLVLFAIVTVVGPAQRALAAAPTTTAVYAAAFRGENGDLWVNGGSGDGDTGVAMAYDSHPAVVEVNAPSHGYQVVVAQQQGDPFPTVATVGPMGWRNLDLCIDQGTSPAAILDTSGATAVLRIVFQCDGDLLEDDLATTSDGHFSGSGQVRDLRLGIMRYTSPDVAVSGGSYQIAFQANTGDLWTRTSSLGSPWSNVVYKDTGLGMKAGTSPSVVAQATGGFQIAFQANTGILWTDGVAGRYKLFYGMDPASSPVLAVSIGSTPSDTSDFFAFQANTHHLWFVRWDFEFGATSPGTEDADTGLGMVPGTSPGMAGAPGPADTIELAFEASGTGHLWYGHWHEVSSSTGAGTFSRGDTGVAMSTFPATPAVG